MDDILYEYLKLNNLGYHLYLKKIYYFIVSKYRIQRIKEFNTVGHIIVPWFSTIALFSNTLRNITPSNFLYNTMNIVNLPKPFFYTGNVHKTKPNLYTIAQITSHAWKQYPF